jgi:LmbE family N-acetylglucosaminyl deacetylase
MRACVQTPLPMPLTDLDLLLQPVGEPRSLRELVFPRPLNMLVLAPHPDDFDAIALSLRHLHRQGHVLDVAVLTGGASGVDDGFAGATDAAAKTALREAEQRASCAFFGLAPQRLSFLRLWEGAADAEADGEGGAPDTDDAARLAAWIVARSPDLLFMPHGNDSNRTHRRTYEAVCAVAARHELPAWACLNQDAKTREMRVDLYFDFDEEDAAWKARLLRFHDSQQVRNLRTRAIGFDARVLQVNRQAAERLRVRRPYAETFELMRLGRRSGPAV